MDKQLLEEYVLEARNLREQIEIVLRIANLMFNPEEFEAISMEDIASTTPLNIRIEDGMAHLG